MPDVREALAPQGMEVLASTPEQLRERMERDAVLWGQVVRNAGIKPE